MTGVTPRVAAAPISWGVCEVPGWGHQMTPERVLGEMSASGLTATELGPDGFLPADPRAAAELLARHDLVAVGGFVPVVLSDEAHDPLPVVDRSLEHLAAAGAGVLVLAAATGRDGYDTRPDLTDAQWATLLGNCDRIAEHAARRGFTATLHPHVGTLVETHEEVQRVLAGSSIGLCLDTGHLLVGGTDPARLVADVPDRIVHTHLKDVDASTADAIREGRMTYSAGVRDGLYPRLGEGDVDVAGIVRALEASGYDGWYVMEQDTVLTGEPAPGEGPLLDVQHGYRFLRGLGSV